MLFEAAIEYAGLALLIRVNRYGVVHEKPAESHYTLGVLYRALNLFDKSRQELLICKSLLFHVDVAVQQGV
jgi:hypothetical protein